MIIVNLSSEVYGLSALLSLKTIKFYCWSLKYSAPVLLHNRYKCLITSFATTFKKIKNRIIIQYIDI